MVAMRGSPVGWGNDSQLSFPCFVWSKSTADAQKHSRGISSYTGALFRMLRSQALAWTAADPEQWSSHRIPRRHQGRSVSPRAVLNGQMMSGPMARNVADLTFAAKGLWTIAQEKRDEGYMMRQRVMPIPWREVEHPKKLKIGYFIDEGCVKVCLPTPTSPSHVHGSDQ